jgi:hypothetical protein
VSNIEEASSAPQVLVFVLSSLVKQVTVCTSKASHLSTSAQVSFSGGKYVYVCTSKAGKLGTCAAQLDTLYDCYLYVAK